MQAGYKYPAYEILIIDEDRKLVKRYYIFPLERREKRAKKNRRY